MCCFGLFYKSATMTTTPRARSRPLASPSIQPYTGAVCNHAQGYVHTFPVTSPFYNRVISPICDKLIANEVIPRWVTPNQLSVCGLACTITAVACATIKLYALAALLWIVYAFLDNLDGKEKSQISPLIIIIITIYPHHPPYIDTPLVFFIYWVPSYIVTFLSLFYALGKQARARNMSSKGGDFMDHGVDSMVSAMTMWIGLMSFIPDEQAANWLCVWFILCGQVSFYLGNWAHFSLGRTLLGGQYTSLNCITVGFINEYVL